MVFIPSSSALIVRHDQATSRPQPLKYPVYLIIGGRKLRSAVAKSWRYGLVRDYKAFGTSGFAEKWLAEGAS
jgi:hypothetical protein